MKTVLITGAAGGLGIGLVREYLSRNYRVFGADIVRHPETDQLAEESGGNCMFFEADVADTASVARLAEQVGAETGSLDVSIDAFPASICFRETFSIRYGSAAPITACAIISSICDTGAAAVYEATVSQLAKGAVVIAVIKTA